MSVAVLCNRHVDEVARMDRSDIVGGADGENAGGLAARAVSAPGAVLRGYPAVSAGAFFVVVIVAVGLVLGGGGGPMATDDDRLELGLYAVLFLLGGLYFVRFGFTRRKRLVLIEDTPTEEIRSLSAGFSEITGRAEPFDGTLDAPFTGDDCLVRTWMIEEWEETDDSSSWRTIAEDVAAVPFVVDDGTGRVRVDPPDTDAVHDPSISPTEVFDMIRRNSADSDAVYDVDGIEEPVVENAVDEATPDAVEQFVTDRDDVTYAAEGVLDGLDAGRQEGDRRYYQALVQPGEDVYVLGTAVPREGAGGPDNPENLSVTHRDGIDPLFLLADKPEQTLIEARKDRSPLLYIGIGIVTATVGLAGFLFLIVLPMIA